jgi:hypothetical protein
MAEHIQSPMPRLVHNNLAQIEAALKAAEDHLHGVISPTNVLAIRAQNAIIAQYKRQIAEYHKQVSDLEGDSWLT